jgi:uncharacterized protein (TIGR02246 family)
MFSHRITAAFLLTAVLALPAACAAAGPEAATLPPAHSAPSADADLDRGTVTRWVESYLKAWKDKDDAAVGKLFTDDAVYQEIPGDEARTYTGRQAIQQYWRTITAGQSDVTAHYGEPVIQGDRAGVELWITLQAGGKWMTIVEANVLHFAQNGQVRRNVEYWTLRDGNFAPPPGWGARG